MGVWPTSGQAGAVYLDETRTWGANDLAVARALSGHTLAALERLRESHERLQQAYLVISTGWAWRRSAVAAMALARAHQRAPRWGREVVLAQVLVAPRPRLRAAAWRGHVGWVRRGTRRPLRGRKRGALLRRARRRSL